jgi:SAM-dependent methyltransferase
MDVRRAIAEILPPVLFRGLTALARTASRGLYERRGRVPFSRGYGEFKDDLIATALQDEVMLRRFREGEPLPDGYGAGLDERVVEYPWCFAHLPAAEGSLLDAGSVLNRELLLSAQVLQNKRVTIFTLAPENECHWDRGISYHYGDLRDMPFTDARFDTIVSLSTLEHVGFDNFSYTGKPEDGEYGPDSFLLAVRELTRILRRGGSLLISVPFGRYRDFGNFQVFDEALLERLIDALPQPGETHVTRFRYSERGWRQAMAEECKDAEFVEWAAHWPLPQPLPVEVDRAAAARAVACVRYVKH